MKIEMNIIIAIMLTFCLTASVFMAIPIQSQSTKTYNPLADINEDGKVSLQDLVLLADAYGTSGTPVNITALQTEIDTLNATVTELQNNNTDLENRVSALEAMYGLPIVNIAGLIGYWRFNQGFGNIASDSSGNNNIGTLVNGPTWVDGIYGKALSFNGVNEYVDVPQCPSLNIANRVSVTAWIYLNAMPSFAYTVLSRWYDGTNPDRGIVLQVFPGSLLFGVIDSSNIFSAPYSFEINKWYCVAATWDGSISRVYVNGLEIGNMSTTGSFTNQNEDLSIGCDLNPFQAFFDGTIDNVMLYNRALSAGEVMTQYLTPPP